MIEPGRTNAIPKTLIILCIGLFVMRAAAVFYGTFFQKAPVNLIAWQQPKPIDRSRRDLLSKPYLYFFFENNNQMNSITAQVFESMLFQNREVARLIKNDFNPVKVAVNGVKADGISKYLSDSFTLYRYPLVYIALPNGKPVHNTSWQSDRMFHAFLSDALMSAITKVTVEAMKSADWALACKAYERANREHHISTWADFNEAIYWSIALRHQKDESRAKEVLEAERNKHRFPFTTAKHDWPAPCTDYLLGKISRDELMKTALAEGDTRGYKALLVHYVCGADLLLRGQRDEAIKELKLAAAKPSSTSLYPAIFARAELQAIGEHVPKVDREDDDTSND